MREGSLDAPVRHPLAWNDPDFYDEEKLDAELRRVFDICHGCRRCFNLCDSFPRLFDLIDESESGELDSVQSKDFKPVVDACTLCDMCFMTKCPYVPPHEFNLDFPHLMLRYRAVEHRKGLVPWVDKQLTNTDRNGRLAGAVAGLANWASDVNNSLTRPLMAHFAGIHRQAKLPRYHAKSFKARATENMPPLNTAAPAHGRKVALYATCFVNYNNPAIGEAALKVLAHNGVETEVVYPSCCGMPQLEYGDIGKVAERARQVSAEMEAWIDKGYDIVALVPSCALMLKFEWPLLAPDDDKVKKLAEATFDFPEFMVGIAQKEGLVDGLKPLDGGIGLHLACHARAQNMGPKAADMLRLIPDTKVDVVERCSGHGGSWGIKKGCFPIALKVGKPTARKMAESGHTSLASECPLAADHIMQGIEELGDNKPSPMPHAESPVILFARAYGLVD